MCVKSYKLHQRRLRVTTGRLRSVANGWLRSVTTGRLRSVTTGRLRSVAKFLVSFKKDIPKT